MRTAGDLRRRTATAVAMILAGIVICGCGSPSIEAYDPQAEAPEVAPTVYDDRPWADVLRNHVKGGLVDYQQLSRSPESLDEFLGHIMYVGPASTPDFFSEPSARLCYYLNAFNACVLKAVLVAGIPPTMHDPREPRLEHDFEFKVDGQVVTLAQLRERAREESSGNARVAFGMCAAALGSPPIPNQPFRPYNLDERLRELAADAMDNPRLVQVDHERQWLLVGLPIWRRQDAFFEMYARETGSRSATMLNCLMHMAGSVRRQYLNRASGYDVRLLKFDRALNAWSPR